MSTVSSMFISSCLHAVTAEGRGLNLGHGHDFRDKEEVYRNDEFCDVSLWYLPKIECGCRGDKKIEIL